MVAVKLEGRLGNQLFQYAFIYATAKKLNTGFYIDKSLENFIPAKYFILKPDVLYPLDALIFGIQGVKNIFSIKLKKSFYAFLARAVFGSKVIRISNTEPAQQVLSAIKNGHMYEGFFQSEMYFDTVKPDIQKMFSVKKRHVDEFTSLFRKIPSTQKKIAIHIRRGDYLDLDWYLPLNYYKTALNAAGYANAFCIFISDDPGFVEREFGYINDKYVSSHNEIIDLQFLINADVCILSNSSFSWWGAWLNNNPKKVVYAPQYWLGFKKGQYEPTDIGNGVDFNWITTH